MLTPSAHSLEMLKGIGGMLSSKRVLTNRIVWTFITATLIVAGGIGYRIARHGDVGLGAVGAFTALTVPLGTIATAVYRKKEEAPNVTS